MTRVHSVCRRRLLGIFAVFAASTFLLTPNVNADSFDWRNVSGANWNTPVAWQIGGSCWNFSSCGAEEAKYMLTRNDPNFQPDVSEQQIEWEGYMGNMGGGNEDAVLDYFTTHGVVTEAECPIKFSDVPVAGDPWPLAAGWQNRVYKSTSNYDVFTGGLSSSNATAKMKTYLKQYGPFETACLGADVDGTGDTFSSVAAAEAYTGTTFGWTNHAVVVVGYVDDPNMANHCGGYWIIKNSWGTGYGDNGYFYVPYGNLENHGDVSAITGAVSFTGPMYRTGVWGPGGANGTQYNGTDATNTWKGTLSSVWDTTVGTSGNWVNNGVGTNQWLNQEQQAVFDNTGSNRAITVNGTVIAHGLTFNSGATGYSFSGGLLTITAGGIQANESVTFNSNVYIGGPQSWNVAAGKSLTVTGPLHTIISNLTFSGAGTTAISGGIDGGGVINLQGGAKPGGLIQAGTGAVTITNMSSFAGDITAQAGAGTLYIAAPGGGAATFNGNFFGGGTINFNCSSLTLGGGGSNFSGTMAWQQPTIVTFVPGAGLAGTFSNVFSTNVSWIWQDGPGTTVLSGTNGYNGTTLVSNGALQADSGVGLPTGSALALDGGVLQSNATTTFTRILSNSTGNNHFDFTANGGGFSAGNNPMTVNIGGSRATLNWGMGVGSGIMGTLKFGSTTANNVTTFQNGINLNGAVRTINVDKNPNSASDIAVISGSIVDSTGTGLGGIVKTGTGTLKLTGANTYGDNAGDNGSTEIQGGAIQADRGAGLSGASGLILNGGVLQSNSATTFTDGIYWQTPITGYCVTWISGGFSAGGGKMTVNLSGDGRTLNWGDTDGKSGIVGTVILSSNTAQYETEVKNGLNLAGGARTIQVDDNPNSTGDFATISGVISDSIGGGSLTKTGAGILQLTGANTYTGPTIATIAPNSALYAGSLYLNSASGPAVQGNVVMNGCYWLIMKAANQFGPNSSVQWLSGAEFDLNGTNQTVAGISSTTGAGLIEAEHPWYADPGSNATLTINNSADCYYNGVIYDGGGYGRTLAIVKSGAGKFTLAGNTTGVNNAWSGGTTVNGGTLQIGDGTTNAVLPGNAVVNSGATIAFDVATGTVATYPGVISGAGSVTVLGTGDLQLTGANTYTGPTIAQNNYYTLYSHLYLNSASGPAVQGNVVLNGCYWLIPQAANQFGPHSSVQWLSSAEFDLNGTNQTVAGISNTLGAGAIEAQHSWYADPGANSTLTINNAADCYYNGVIYDGCGGCYGRTLAIVKSGAGKLTLAGTTGVNNAWTGGTTVNGGTLQFGDGTSNAVLPGNAVVNSGATIAFDVATSTVATYPGVISGAGSVTVLGTGDLQLTGANTYTGPTIAQNNYYTLYSHLYLNSTSGPAVQGNVVLNGCYWLIPQAANQFGPHSSVQWLSSAEFDLNGTNQTVAGISDTLGLGAIEAQHPWYADPGANSTLTINNSTDCDYNGVIYDGGGYSRTLAIVKSGSGKLTLAGSPYNLTNAWTGGTTINGGTLQIGDGTLNATLPGNVTDNATLAFNVANGTTNTYGGVISGTGNVNCVGLGAMILNGTTANTYTGTTTVSAGVLQADNTVGLPNASFLVINGGVLQSNATSAVTFTRGLATSGAGKFEWGASGGGFSAGPAAMNVNIGGSNAQITWGTTVGTNLVGTLVLSSTTAANVTTLSNPIALGTSARTVQVNDNTATAADYAVLSGVVSGTGGLTKTGAGVLALTATNTYTGTTTVSAGALQANNAAGLNNSSFLSLDGGVLQSNGSTAVSFTRGLATSGAGKFQFTANGGGFSAGAAAMNVNIGGSNAQITWGTTVGTNLVGTLKFGSTTAANVTTLSNPIALGTSARTVQVDDNPYSTADYAVLSGVLSGTGGITKTGTGKLVLTGANTYTGATTVNAGLLAATGTAAHAAITVNSGGAFSPGNSVGSATTGAATWNSGGKYSFEIDSATGSAGSAWDLWSITGGLTDTSTFTVSAITESSNGVLGQMANFNNANSYQWLLASTTGTMPSNLVSLLTLDGSGFQNALASTGHIYLAESSDYKSLYLDYSPTGGNGHAFVAAGPAISAAPVPEPGTLAMLAVGLVGLLAYAWRKRK